MTTTTAYRALLEHEIYNRKLTPDEQAAIRAEIHRLTELLKRYRNAL